MKVTSSTAEGNGKRKWETPELVACDEGLGDVESGLAPITDGIEAPDS